MSFFFIKKVNEYGLRGQHLTSPPYTEPEFSTVKDTVNAGRSLGVFLSDLGSSNSNSNSNSNSHTRRL